MRISLSESGGVGRSSEWVDFGTLDTQSVADGRTIAAQIVELGFFSLPRRVGATNHDETALRLTVIEGARTHSVDFTAATVADELASRVIWSLQAVAQSVLANLATESSALRLFAPQSVQLVEATIEGAFGIDHRAQVSYSSQAGFTLRTRVAGSQVWSESRPLEDSDQRALLHSLLVNEQALTPAARHIAQTLAATLSTDLLHPRDAVGSATSNAVFALRT